MDFCFTPIQPSIHSTIRWLYPWLKLLTSSAGVVVAEDQFVFTITADSYYAIAEVQVDGVSVGVVGTYTFTNVTGGHTIHATFM